MFLLSRVCIPRAALLFGSIVAIGCASSGDEATVDSDEAELTKTCDLGSSCPEAFKVLTGRSESSVPRNDVRDDVTVAWQGNPEFPAAQFAGATSRKLRFAGQGRVTLTGNAQGTAPFRVDDFLLIEVLAENGAVLKTGVVNPTVPVAIDGAAPPTLAPMPAWGGAQQGWSYPEVDITALLPKDQTVRLRLGAYDVTGFAVITDVYLRTVAVAPPPPPPPPPVDPFDPSSCQGAPWSAAEALARFAPATTATTLTRSLVIASRERSCGTSTGCTAWNAITKLPYRHRTDSSLYGHLDSVTSFPLPVEEGYVGMYLRQGNSDANRIRLRVGFRSGSLGTNIDLPFNAARGADGADVGKCTSVPCFDAGGYVRDYGDSLTLDGNYAANKGTGGVSGPHVVTRQCMRLTGKTSVAWSNNLGRTETEYVILGRY
jgi:hypothetical protein